jgi:formate/nitrite transporter FocA (FNT family)
MVGTLLAAAFCTNIPALTPELKAGMLDVAGHIMGHSWPETLFRAIAAGFLMATMVWLIPSADPTQFHVNIFMTFLISAGEFMHIVAASVEAFLLVLKGHLGF